MKRIFIWFINKNYINSTRDFHIREIGNYQHEDPDEPPGIEEVIEICQNMKSNKSRGLNHKTAEMFKYGKLKLMKKTQKRMREIWSENSKEWTQGTIYTEV